MKMLMLCNYAPNAVLRCQCYTCNTYERFGKFNFIVSLQANGITSSPSGSSSQQFTFLFAFPKSHDCLRVSSQSIHWSTRSSITSRDLWLRVCQWWLCMYPSVGVDGLLCPDFLHQYYGERPPSTDIQRECPVLSAVFNSLPHLSHSFLYCLSLPSRMILQSVLC